MEEKKKIETLTGYELILRGDLRNMFIPDREDEAWKNQDKWELAYWDLYDSSEIHCLTLNEYTHYMFIDKKYPLTKNTLKRMLAWRITVKKNSTKIGELIKNLKQQLNE